MVSACTAPPAFEPAAASASFPATRFDVRALADPGTLPRILELFANRGLVPDRVRSAQDGEHVRVRIEIEGMEDDLARYIAECLRQIYVVEAVDIRI